MVSYSILQKGNIYIFYRPKIQHSYASHIDDVQGLLLVLKPELNENYIIIRIGRKRLPEEEIFFSFIEKVCHSASEVKNLFSKESYKTSTDEIHEINAAQCVAEGKYLLIDHDDHAHLCFQLDNFEKDSDLLKEFHLKEAADYLISVKNPKKHTPKGVGLPASEKAIYPEELQNYFSNYRFIPLKSPEFLNYEGAEFLIIGKNKSELTKDTDIKKCLENISTDVLDQYFQVIQNADQSAFKILK